MKQVLQNIIPAKNLQKKKSAPGNFNEANTLELPGETIGDRCRTFAYMLGLDEPVPERVLTAAIENTGYMRRLLASTNNIPALYDLLNNPPSPVVRNSFSNSELIAKAGKALMKWAVSGFPTVSKEQLKKREDACLSCPNLSEATHSIQRFSASADVTEKVGWRTGNRACASCGCVVHNKIRLATESCPEHISGNENINRWGELMANS
ncbi:MAG TPA: hypothetical protein VL651_14610 [Bacteroidia bacterium]|nr:hypothetical protein [Bacteroidia bacterium]